MRYAIFSDIHSNLEALGAVLRAYVHERIDGYFCAGDIVGYGADPKECIERVQQLPALTVAGNHDWAVTDQVSVEHFNPAAQAAIEWTRNNLDSGFKYFLEKLPLVYKNENFTLVHGTLPNPEEFNYLIDSYTAWQTFEIQETDLCFVGHTHVAGIFIKHTDGSMEYSVEPLVKIQKQNRYIVNVGSVGQPRDNNPQAVYCILDTEEKTIEIKRVNYDIKTARQKIIDSGLPEFLGNRLLLGM